MDSGDCGPGEVRPHMAALWGGVHHGSEPEHRLVGHAFCAHRHGRHEGPCRRRPDGQHPCLHGSPPGDRLAAGTPGRQTCHPGGGGNRPAGHVGDGAGRVRRDRSQWNRWPSVDLDDDRRRRAGRGGDGPVLAVPDELGLRQLRGPGAESAAGTIQRVLVQRRGRRPAGRGVAGREGALVADAGRSPVFRGFFPAPGVGPQNTKCGMRNAECGINPSPYSALRTPHSAFRGPGPGRHARGFPLDVADRLVLCLGLLCDCPLAVCLAVYGHGLHRVAVRRVSDDGRLVQLPDVDRRRALGVLAFPRDCCSGPRAWSCWPCCWSSTAGP